MRPKKFSYHLIEVRTALGLSQEEMAFVLDIKEQMYKLWEKGDFDDAEETRYKSKVNFKLATLELEIEKKILILKTALCKFQMSTYFYTVRAAAIKIKQKADEKHVKKNVTTLHSNHRNSNGKGSNH